MIPKKNIDRLLLIGLSGTLIIGLYLFITNINAFFLADDFFIINNIKNNGIFGLWTIRDRFFRPVISTSIFIDYKIWGLNPIGYNLSNLLHHIANSLLVCYISFLALKKIPLTKTYIPIITGLIYFILPSHSEAVVWIAGRTDVIATFYCLLTIAAYATYTLHAPQKPLYFILSLIFLGLALASKESSLTIPVLLIFYEVFMYFTHKEKKRLSTSVIKISLIIALFILYFIIRYLCLGELLGGYGSEKHLNFTLLLLFKNIILYTVRTLLPMTFGMSNRLFLVFLIISGIYIFKIRKDKKLLLLSLILLASFLITVLPSLNLGLHPKETQGERFLYLPSVFICILIPLIIHQLLTNKIAFYGVIITHLLFYGYYLRININNWNKASQTSYTLLQSLQEIPAPEKDGKVYITSLPDNYKGAYIYRNGLPAAVALFKEKLTITIPPSKIIILLLHNIKNTDNYIDITTNNTTISLKQSHKYTYIWEDERKDIQNNLAKYCRLTPKGPAAYEIQLTSLTPEDIILYYSKQKLVRL